MWDSIVTLIIIALVVLILVAIATQYLLPIAMGALVVAGVCYGLYKLTSNENNYFSLDPIKL